MSVWVQESALSWAHQERHSSVCLLCVNQSGIEQEPFVRTDIEQVCSKLRSVLKIDTTRFKFKKECHFKQLCKNINSTDKRKSKTNVQLFRPSLGMLSGKMKKIPEAEDHFKKAIQLCEKAGSNMWLPHINYRYAQMLVLFDSQHSAAKAWQLVEQARQSAQSMQMRNILNKIEELRNTADESKRNPIKALTSREKEVLNLIVQGKSNKAIAAELNRSLATVATHVRSILEKTNATNRTEAATFAIDHGWLTESRTGFD